MHVACRGNTIGGCVHQTERAWWWSPRSAARVLYFLESSLCVRSNVRFKDDSEYSPLPLHVFQGKLVRLDALLYRSQLQETVVKAVVSHPMCPGTWKDWLGEIFGEEVDGDSAAAASATSHVRYIHDAVSPSDASGGCCEVNGDTYSRSVGEGSSCRRFEDIG